MNILKCYGIGYKIKFKENYLYLRFGYSHYIYIRFPLNCKIFLYKKYIFIYATLLNSLTKLRTILLQLRRLNCYKLKGILTLGERIALKQGKV